MASSKTIILYHGNCIDGWMSAYIAHTYLKNFTAVEMYPISPHQPHTWPAVGKMNGANIILLDVSVEKKYRSLWYKHGALSIKCIDHHESSIAHWSPKKCPIDTSCCVALQVWRQCYPGLAEPQWLHCVDRIDRWDNPSYEDRCVREVLNVIAHLPVQGKTDEALHLSDQFVGQIMTPEGFAGILTTGKGILDVKDAELMRLLSKGQIHTITPEYVNGWKLPAEWLGAKFFIIDNTSVTIDTTEAAHLVLLHNPEVTAFVNYRKKTICGHGKDVDTKTVYLFSARARSTDEFNLTAEGSILKGHRSAAGASLIKENVDVVPFVVVNA